VAESIDIVFAHFPVRKRVRLLTLISTKSGTSEWHILQSTEYPGLFGALDAAHRSLIAPGGVGPMVLMLEPGDTGAVCILNEE
jgi:hypothetical protein